MNFNMLRVPNKRQEIMHVYYKQYQTGQLAKELHLEEFDPKTTLYAIQLTGEINVHIIKNVFGIAGKINEVHTGKFTNKHNNKKKRRTYYFALVVYDTEKSLQQSLDRDHLQKQINAKFKNSPALIALPPDEIDVKRRVMTESEAKLEKQREIMEEDGFTMVLEKKSGILLI